ncbi:Poly(A) RNA polymerase [Quillaja saponaria]|uniref:Poly(A) RNA polymerase n=1 Tax=Quillaja saponaria TaxID=32244 RepID=A0AAD7LW13_QUISA|nr:Poly(A) RNA polymerase [Quillaja saponaria]
MEDLHGNLSPPSSLSSSSSSSPNLHPLLIDEELWLMAEERAQEILCTIQPNVASEQNRKDVIEYVQRRIKSFFGAEVFSFGSVPLKTYLPDGDIDLTALSHQNLEEDLAQQVCSILESGEDLEFQIEDIQYIRAQVKVVKCTVKNIAVDISFNQMAGLCTLCFLEQVDQLIGKNHLFKRSIILIKAWCFYESRILGAHHGLMSTYALETLVLYIINVFHSSLRGPLEVLYRFLDYYSTFDWDSYCVSVNGPIAISSLPEIVETSHCEGNELFLSKEFMRNCRDIFSVPARVCETVVHEFPIKHLNIVDPSKKHKQPGAYLVHSLIDNGLFYHLPGNFHRIRCALSFGAQKLEEILRLPGEGMGEALEKFFKNTLARNGKGQRPDVQVPVPAFGTGRSEASDLSGDYDSYYSGLQYCQWFNSYTIPVTALPSPPLSPSQLQNSSCDILAQSAQYDWSILYQLGNDVYVQGQTFCLPNASQQSAATFSIEEKGKSRGTGTYIPDMTHHSYMHTRVSRSRKLDSHHVLLKSPQKANQVEDCSETDMPTNGDGSSFKVSIEDFPVLPSNHNKATPSENHQSLKLTCKSEEANSSLPHLSIEFGTYKPTTLKLDLPVKSEQADVLATFDTMLGISRIAMPKEEFSGSDEAQGTCPTMPGRR